MPIYKQREKKDEKKPDYSHMRAGLLGLHCRDKRDVWAGISGVCARWIVRLGAEYGAADAGWGVKH